MCSFPSPLGGLLRLAPNPTFASGAQIAVRTLLELGVDTIFGYSGAAVLPLFDSLYAVSGGPANVSLRPGAKATGAESYPPADQIISYPYF